jgi:hypothetical protein
VAAPLQDFAVTAPTIHPGLVMLHVANAEMVKGEWGLRNIHASKHSCGYRYVQASTVFFDVVINQTVAVL